MKVKSTHEVTLTREELAEKLGFRGGVIGHQIEGADYTFRVEGDVAPSAPAPLVTMPAREVLDSVVPALTASTEDRRTLMVEFTTTGDFVALVAYADELKREIEMMLARVPEPGVTATVTVR